MILAVDIGGTKIAAARVTTDGHLASDIAQLPTPAQDGPAAVMRAVEAVVRELGDAGQVGHEVQAIGVSAAGVIDSERGMVLAATSSIAGWAGTDITTHLRDTFGVPTSVINDGNAFALGESRFGAGRGLGDVLLLAVGTGVGGGYVHAGQPVLGAHHVGGHLGHLVVPQAQSMTCPCGAKGHLEAIAGGAGMLAWYHTSGGELSVTSARELFGRDGDTLASNAIRLGATAAGTAAGGLANALDPGVVVFAGGVVSAGAQWTQPAQAAFRATLMPALAELPLVCAASGVEMALRGAAAFVQGRIQL